LPFEDLVRIEEWAKYREQEILRNLLFENLELPGMHDYHKWSYEYL